jgi:predicted transposase YbfD/YdcC
VLLEVSALARPTVEPVTAGRGEEALPEFIGRYRVVERLGTGGQGDVYRATHPTLNRLVVIKVARADLSNGEAQTTAIPKLLELLDITGCIVTIDAIGTQKAIAEQIVDAGGDYVLAVKENQPTLFADIRALLNKALDTDFAGLDYDLFQSEETGHGRSETRTYLAIHEPAGLSTLADWKGLKTVIIVTRERQEGSNNSTQQHYYISSAELRQRAWEEVIRGHWGIENSLHWVLDVVFREDACRTQHENAACNLALLRKIALALLKRVPGKGSMPDKRLRAGWDEPYLEKVLGLLSAKEDELPSSPAQAHAPRLHAPSPD